MAKMDLQGFGFSNDDEYNFISERTGYSSDLVEFILWQRYCYEMEIDLRAIDEKYNSEYKKALEESQKS